jgi:DNA repair exonuclease SbcCD nuclease subunit
MVNILHTADVHLDRAFSSMGMSQGIAATRREELRAALRRFIDLAIESKADVVTIGGDLFEHDRATLDTGHFLRQQFERLGAVPLFVAPGNHDPYVPDSLYRRVEWPANVAVFQEPRLSPVQAAPGLTIWGAGHDGPALRTNLLEGFRVYGEGRHVLLFHGSDVGSVPEGKLAHCPFRSEDVAATGADFALLGHYHRPRLQPETGPRFGYPGSPEPLDFGEEGSHCVLRLHVSDAVVRAELVDFGRVSYRTQGIDVSNMTSSDELRSAIAALPGGGIVRLVLGGQLQPEVDLDIGTLYNTCAELFDFLDIVDRTEPGYDLDQLCEESTTKGMFVRLMRGRIDRLAGGEREIAEEALTLGLRAFDRKELVH